MYSIIAYFTAQLNAFASKIHKQAPIVTFASALLPPLKTRRVKILANFSFKRRFIIDIRAKIIYSLESGELVF